MTTEVYLKSSLILIRILLDGLIIIQQFRAVDTHRIVILVRNSNVVSKKKIKKTRLKTNSILDCEFKYT